MEKPPALAWSWAREPKELVHGGERLLVGGGDHNPAALQSGLERVLDVRLELRHRGGSRRRHAVHEHRRVEVARGEHHRDMTQMTLDLIAAFLVVLRVRVHLDDAPVGAKKEVMRGLLV